MRRYGIRWRMLLGLLRSSCPQSSRDCVLGWSPVTGLMLTPRLDIATFSAGIYFSEQQFVSANGETDPGAFGTVQQLSPQQTMARFGDFIRNFQEDRTSNLFPYADQLARSKTMLRVDLGHLLHPKYGAPELAHLLVDNPTEYLPLFEAAAKQESERIMSRSNADEDGEGSGADMAPDVQVMLFKSGANGSLTKPLSMREIKPEQCVVYDMLALRSEDSNVSVF